MNNMETDIRAQFLAAWRDVRLAMGAATTQGRGMSCPCPSRPRAAWSNASAASSQSPSACCGAGA